MKTPLQILTDARALIDSPEKWTQGVLSKEVNGVTQRCAIGAISDATDSFDTDARVYLRKAIGQSLVARWNNAPERTHAEVLAAFTRAIELARNKEAK